MAAPTVSDPRRRDDEREEHALYLVVVGPGFTSSHPLPASGTLLVGRAEDAEVRIVDEKASRQHARLHVGATLEVEDLDSANGTRVRDRELQPGERVPFSPGETIAVGDTILVVQRRGSGTRPRRILPHGYFETALIEECARAEALRGSFALARLHVARGTPAEEVERVADAVLRRGDLLGDYGPGELEILLPDSDRAPAEALMARLTEALAAAGIIARTGLAFFPGDGRSPQALFSHACSLVRGAKDRGAPGPDMVIQSPAMRAVYELAERAAAGGSNVLITGETGSGKDLLAETIHRRSPRARGPFVAFNCAAVPDTLLESELFGYERGAFSGATQARPGLLEAASGGTVFLDEIGEMSLGHQAKLLRVLEKRQVLRLGSTEPRPVDVRFVAATNRDLEEEVAQKTFREDLYFRLNVIKLSIPPLREREEEIEPLARLFVETVARQLGRPPPALSPAALDLLRAHDWPGNVRELRNVMERALVYCEGSVIAAEHVHIETRRPGAEPVAADRPEIAVPGPEWRSQQREIERRAILDALDRCAGNQTRAAEWIGMPRRTFCKRLKELGILRPRAARDG